MISAKRLVRRAEERLDEIRAADRWRVVRTLRPTGPTTGEIDGRQVIVACSNDYLGLAWDPDVRAAAAGGGSGGSRLISGARPVHRQLEEVVGDWLGRPALLFNSGWNANLGLLQALGEPGARIASDALNHASIIDGLRLSRAERQVVAHADPSAIPRDTDAWVAEGLFSMDGDIPPFPGYPTGPLSVVDEAHAVGCLGPEGRGAAAMLGVEADVIVGTFGKAFGASGAFVAGPRPVIDLLVNTARSFVFTTALPEPVAAMALAGLRRADDALRERLAANTERFRCALHQLGWTPLGDAHVVPVVVGPGAMGLAERLLASGVFAPAIRWPTVARGQERIRFTVSAAHTPEQLDRVAEALGPAT
ncbi:MAG: aminotransferase class I/II-fold pyridoxal phosphate-dependent enzyme [Myxococcales bacterium]|nr:aminotransferase class I/II-fold pyridoxal phosphate-dependent enzyme [Myxococcales bacterium]